MRSRVRALREEGVSYEEREREFIKEVNGGFGSNGNGSASEYEYKNGSVEGYNNTNGGVGVVEGESNGSLVKYVNGNGNGAAAEVMAAEVVEVEGKEGVVSEEARKKRVEDIGKEEAWFKRSTQDQVEVLGFTFCGVGTDLEKFLSFFCFYLLFLFLKGSADLESKTVLIQREPKYKSKF